MKKSDYCVTPGCVKGGLISEDSFNLAPSYKKVSNHYPSSLRVLKYQYHIPQITLVYQIEVQAQIKVQVGEFLEITQCAVRNKRAGKKPSNMQDLLDVQR